MKLENSQKRTESTMLLSLDKTLTNWQKGIEEIKPSISTKQFSSPSFSYQLSLKYLQNENSESQHIII